MIVDIEFGGIGYWTYVLQKSESDNGDNGGGSDPVGTTITGVDFAIAELNGDGNEVGVTPTSTGGTLYSVDFGDPAAANDEDVIATSGAEVSYTYAKESATYTITVTASASNASDVLVTKDHSVTIEDNGGGDDYGLEGSWSIADEAGALGVGPTQGNISWWTLGEQGVTDRACHLDDEFVFRADGSFANVMGESTWLEEWQGGDGCGAPVYPHDGAATDYTYSYDADAGTITVNGVGAHLGLAKVFNGGELTSPSEAAGIESITYTIVEMEAARMTLDIQFQAGGGYWTYVLQKSEPYLSVKNPDFNSIKMYPNPVTSILSINSYTIELTKVQIFSSLGKKVKEVTKDFKSINVGELSNGVYFVKAYSENKIITRKMIKR